MQFLHIFYFEATLLTLLQRWYDESNGELGYVNITAGIMALVKLIITAMAFTFVFASSATSPASDSPTAFSASLVAPSTTELAVPRKARRRRHRCASETPRLPLILPPMMLRGVAVPSLLAPAPAPAPAVVGRPTGSGTKACVTLVLAAMTSAATA